MPFGDGVDILNIMTWSWMEYVIVVAGFILVILLCVVLPIGLSKKNKANAQPKVKGKSQTGLASGGKKLTFTAESGEVLMFTGEHAWYVGKEGRTELYTALETTPVLAGKVVYLAKDVKKVQVVQENNEFVKYATQERQYITFDFISKGEVKLGHKAFLTEKEITLRDDLQRKEEARLAKEQAIADKKALKAQKKADK